MPTGMTQLSDSRNTAGLPSKTTAATTAIAAATRTTTATATTGAPSIRHETLRGTRRRRGAEQLSLSCLIVNDAVLDTVPTD